jgi:hypothetical protein
MPPSGSLVPAPPRRAPVDAADADGAYDYAETNALIVAELQHDVVRLQGARRTRRAAGCAIGSRRRAAARNRIPRIRRAARRHGSAHPPRLLER